MFYVYSIFNITNGKLYIGKTNNLHRRWIEHQRIARGGAELYDEYSVIHAAINKYGVDNFEFSELQKFDIEIIAYQAEEYWIRFFNSRDPEFGYNITVGGIGSGSGEDSPNFGLKRSEETISKLRTTHLGKRNSNYGKIFSNEVRQNMSKAQTRFGENQSHVILTWEKVDEMRRLYSNGVKISELSRIFNTNRSNVHSIVNFKTWNKR